MSEMLKWAEKFVKKANDMSTPVSAGVVDSHLYGLACAILADADPSNAATSPEPLPWDGEWGIPELSDDDEPAARPSGGEGAHDWEMVGEGDRYNSSHCCRKCGEYADKEVGNGPCRGEGAPEPDALRELVAVLTAHRACTGTEHDPANGKIHGYCVVCGVPWPCEYVGLPPEREAERVFVNRGRRGGKTWEAEIRADERRTIREKVKALKYGDGGHQHNIWDAALDRVINRVVPVEARLSPTDEQESPNRSDEP